MISSHDPWPKTLLMRQPWPFDSLISEEWRCQRTNAWHNGKAFPPSWMLGVAGLDLCSRDSNALYKTVLYRRSLFLLFASQSPSLWGKRRKDYRSLEKNSDLLPASTRWRVKTKIVFPVSFMSLNFHEEEARAPPPPPQAILCGEEKEKITEVWRRTVIYCLQVLDGG
ncbi:hypothetical protein MRB53_011109 [Persea americana]|uniref:Uncharacterized protein n=1 Tax=Persea americana TaxID=3435 RepID=A0ACC2LUM3_PERAE|nr:hypothetical protein MRB53_011109 [Persea americana]